MQERRVVHNSKLLLFLIILFGRLSCFGLHQQTIDPKRKAIWKTKPLVSVQKQHNVFINVIRRANVKD